MSDKKKVDSEQPEEEPQVTPPEEEVTPGEETGVAEGQEATPGEAVGDADQEAKRIREEKDAEIAKLTEKYERDLSQLKSSLQSGEAARSKAAQERIDTLELELYDLKTRDMDEAQRAQYDRDMLLKDREDLVQRIDELEALRDEDESKRKMAEIFMENGITLDRLDMSGSYEQMFGSGFNALVQDLNELRKGVEAPGGTPPPETPPDVDTSPGGTPSSGTSWAELRKIYSDEELYQMVEQGRLDGDIIPPA